MFPEGLVDKHYFHYRNPINLILVELLAYQMEDTGLASLRNTSQIDLTSVLSYAGFPFPLVFRSYVLPVQACVGVNF